MGSNTTIANSTRQHASWCMPFLVQPHDTKHVLRRGARHRVAKVGRATATHRTTIKSSHAFVSYRPREACGYHGKHACVTGSGVFQTPETDTHYRALGNSDLSLALATRHSRSACIARSRVAVGRDRNYVAMASPKVSCRVRCSKNSEQPPFRLALCRRRKCAHVWVAHEKLKLSCLFHYFQRKAWVWTRRTLDSTLQTRPLRN